MNFQPTEENITLHGLGFLQLQLTKAEPNVTGSKVGKS